MMARTLCGRSVHPIGLGCMNLSWAYSDPPEPAEKVRLLNEALDLGYDSVPAFTAPVDSDDDAVYAWFATPVVAS